MTYLRRVYLKLTQSRKSKHFIHSNEIEYLKKIREEINLILDERIVYIDGCKEKWTKKEIINEMKKYPCSGICNHCNKTTIWTYKNHEKICGKDNCIGKIGA